MPINPENPVRQLGFTEFSPIPSIRDFTITDVNNLLTFYRRTVLRRREASPVIFKYKPNPGSALDRYIAERNKDAKDAAKELVDVVLNEMGIADLTDREKLLYGFLDLRYRRAEEMDRIGRELNYSREHLGRNIRIEAMMFFLDYIQKPRPVFQNISAPVTQIDKSYMVH